MALCGSEDRLEDAEEPGRLADGGLQVTLLCIRSLGIREPTPGV